MTFSGGSFAIQLSHRARTPLDRDIFFPVTIAILHIAKL
jgi:hypothetical protein